MQVSGVFFVDGGTDYDTDKNLWFVVSDYNFRLWDKLTHLIDGNP